MDEMVKQTQTWLNKTYCGSAGYTPFSENELDGITGQGTFKRLIQGLQIELNIWMFTHCRWKFRKCNHKCTSAHNCNRIFI